MLLFLIILLSYTDTVFHVPLVLQQELEQRGKLKKATAHQVCAAR